ncbi:MAG: glycosyltransferase family 2 protein [Gemmatimonadota bacterium]
MFSTTPQVTAVVVSYNTRELTIRAVASLEEQRGVDVAAVVVDNGSADGSVEALRARFPQIQVIEVGENLGFGRANNLGALHATTPYLLFLNSDAWFSDQDGLAALVEAADRDELCAAVGPRVESEDGSLQWSARRAPTIARELCTRTELWRLLPQAWRSGWLLGPQFAHDRRQTVDWVIGACMLVRTEWFHGVSGFDPAIFLYGEELDLCLRMRRSGGRIWFDPAASVIHVGGASGEGTSARKVGRVVSGERIALARDRGEAYAWAFSLARAIAATVEGTLFGIAGALRGGSYRRVRAREAVHVAGSSFRELLRPALRAGAAR